MTAADPLAEVEAAFLSGDQWRDPLQHLLLCDFLEERCGRPREAAMRRILVEPAEDRHRLDYAGLLEREAADAQAELKSVREELSRLEVGAVGPTGKPVSPYSLWQPADRRFARLQIRARELSRAGSDAVRAEFIKVQVELANRKEPPKDAGVCPWCRKGIIGGGPHADDCRYMTLRRRERELFAQSDVTRGWFGPAWEFTVAGRPWADYLQWFRRGFVAALTLTATDFLRHAAGVFGAQPIEEVTLSCRNAGPGMRRAPLTWFASPGWDVVPAAVGSNSLPWSIAVGLGIDRAQKRAYPRFVRYEWQYDDCRSADTALSTAAVAYGRSAAHLSPLPVRGLAV